MTPVSAVPRPPAGMATDQARIARTLRMVARMANGAQASLVARGDDLAAFHHEIARAERQPCRAVVVIDQAVDLRRALQSDHADAGEILRALHSVPSQRLQDAQLVLAMTSAISTSATVHFAVNAASSSLGPISRCVVAELDTSAARAVAVLAGRFIRTGVWTSHRLTDHLTVLSAIHRQSTEPPPGV